MIVDASCILKAAHVYEQLALDVAPDLGEELRVRAATIRQYPLGFDPAKHTEGTREACLEILEHDQALLAFLSGDQSLRELAQKYEQHAGTSMEEARDEGAALGVSARFTQEGIGAEAAKVAAEYSELIRQTSEQPLQGEL